MKTTNKSVEVKTTASKRVPPWCNYVSSTVSTIKVGKYYVTVEVTK